MEHFSGAPFWDLFALACLGWALTLYERAKWRELALIDRLTRAASPYATELALDRLEGRSSKRGWFGRMIRPRVVVIGLDIDLFGLVNNTFGHDIGDIVLIEVTRRMRESLRPADRAIRVYQLVEREFTGSPPSSVNRKGGEEYILITNGADREGAMNTANRLVEALRVPFELRLSPEALSVALVNITEARPNGVNLVVYDSWN